MEAGCSDQSEVILTAEEVRAARSDLVAIGSHGVAHVHLTAVSPAQLGFELEESRRVLEEILREPVPLFSYPYGAHDGPVVERTRAAGYVRAFTIEPRSAFREPREFLTGRVPLDPDDWRLEWCLKMRGAYSWLPLASRLERRLRGVPSSPRRDARWRTLE
jgi:peptidoglycan/xylan/chitin deacetylase (PgdA/CDA1 family)